MSRRLFTARQAVRTAAAIAALWCAASTPALADEPTAMMRNIMSATVAEVTVYDVRPDQGQQFLDAMVTHGPYDQLMAGAVSEKLLAPLPGSNGRWMALSRYLDGATARRVADSRDKKLAGLVAGQPERVSGTLVQHVFADWGWEKGSPARMLDVYPVGSEAIFEQRLTSLSFLKSGYTGQAGMVEFFDASYSPERLRALVAGRSGLSGASIYVTADKSYFMYSEYFNSPANAARVSMQASANRGQAGTVEMNYTPR
jgi:hypothetical protein